MTWRNRLAMIAALGSVACSSYNRASSAGDSGATSELPAVGTDAALPRDVPTTPDIPMTPIDSGGPGYSCARLCRRLASIPGCMGAEGGCNDRCTMDLGRFPSECSSQFMVLFACVERTADSRISCGAAGFPYLDCTMANGMAVTCAQTFR